MRSAAKVRNLDANTLGVAIPVAAPEPPPSPDAPLDFDLTDDDATMEEVEQLLTEYGGVILTGPPGTSKSWYAAQIAARLADRDPSRVRFLQFHPSYQYEDFVEGYVPRDDGNGFDLRAKHLVQMAKLASDIDPGFCVIVIDELSRGDPGRIFGEALTYVERTKRGRNFRIASGRELCIPANLVFIATMNPLDRGVDEVDAAFERRFAKVAMEPSATILRQFLEDSQMDEALRERVITFFAVVQREARNNPYAQMGHTFFYGVRDEADLRRLWRHQLRFLFDKAYRLDDVGRRTIQTAWNQVVPVQDQAAVGIGSSTASAPETPIEATTVGKSPGVAPTPDASQNSP
jgi:5-methylcytosine-specific restriction protein B